MYAEPVQSPRDHTDSPPPGRVDGFRDELTEEFTVTVLQGDNHTRIIGMAIAIKGVSKHLVRHDISMRCQEQEGPSTARKA